MACIVITQQKGQKAKETQTVKGSKIFPGALTITTNNKKTEIFLGEEIEVILYNQDITTSDNKEHIVLGSEQEAAIISINGVNYSIIHTTKNNLRIINIINNLKQLGIP